MPAARPLTLLDQFPPRILIDIDGVCYLRGTRIPDAAEAVQSIAASGRAVAYVTNNSWDVPSTYAEALEGLGFPAEIAQVITSSMAAAKLLSEGSGPDRLSAVPPGAPVAVMGGPGIRSALKDAGFDPVAVEAASGRSPSDVGALVVGVDRDLSYERLSEAARLAREGAAFVATNTDATFPTEMGLLPGAGAIVDAVRRASGVDPVVAGKPESGMALAVEDVVGIGEAMVIGDRIETDIAFARRHGYQSGLVLTGVSRVADLEKSEDLPDLVARSIIDLIGDPVRIRREESGAFEVSGGSGSLRGEVERSLAVRPANTH